MKRVAIWSVLAAALTVFAAVGTAGCGSAPSTAIAPDVKEPDNRNVSGEEILKRRQAGDMGQTPPR